MNKTVNQFLPALLTVSRLCGLVSIIWLLAAAGWHAFFSMALFAIVAFLIMVMSAAVINGPFKAVQQSAASEKAVTIAAIVSQIFNIALAAFLIYKVFGWIFNRFAGQNTILLLLLAYSFVSWVYMTISHNEAKKISYFWSYEYGRIWCFFILTAVLIASVFVYIFSSLLPLLIIIPVYMIPVAAAGIGESKKSNVK